MSTPRSQLPAIQFQPRIGRASLSEIPRERTINIQVLLDLSPDREALLTGGKPIDEIRRALKLHVKTLEGHWLQQVYRGRSIRPRDATVSISDFIVDAQPAPEPAPLGIYNEHLEGHHQPGNKDRHVIRHVLSGPSLYGAPSAATTFETLEDHSIGGGPKVLGIWSSLALSTAHQLISPRPLGPTHVLVVYAKPSQNQSAAAQHRHRRSNSVTPSPSHPEPLEVAINDLLFVVNSPNLLMYPALPRRLERDLPRVVIRGVPHIDTFPELNAYLRTKNQAALFRALLPEWLRDVMHPLPPFNQQEINASSTNSARGDGILRHTKSSGFLSGLFQASTVATTSKESPPPASSFGSSLCCISNSSTVSVDTIVTQENLIPPAPAQTRTIASIAKDIADAYCDSSLAIGRIGRDDALINAMIALDALADNLEFIGYYSKNLWSELTMNRLILIRAIAFASKDNVDDET
ncbi:hypothetical protein HGRIS_012177 [Hohenbuehelia grisea]|uniref:Uncharacterized protein n=1 Tax=Hohenbuehelia grisea TaxID=104357 RepID=A0ABR3IRI6_9AGAR